MITNEDVKKSEYFNNRQVDANYYSEYSIPRYLNSNLPPNKGTKFLDIGCGFGQFLFALKQKGYTNLTGIDINNESINECVNKNLNAIQISDIREFAKNSTEKYVITLVPNPEYADNSTYRAIPFSEEGKTNNLKIIGLSKFEFLPTINENDPDYGNTNFYQFKTIHYINDILQTETISVPDEFTFILQKGGTSDDDNLGDIQTLTVVLTGADNSAELLIDNADGTEEVVKLKSGINTITTLLGKIVTIQSDKPAKLRIGKQTISRITKISVSADGYTSQTLLAVTDTESVSTKITIDKTYVVDIQTETIPVISLDKPFISFVNPDLNRKHNINSEIDTLIGIYKNTFTSGVRVKFANEEFTYSELESGESALITIPQSKLGIVGNYRIIIIPFTGDGNDGEPIELILTGSQPYSLIR